jgi:beta-galactosidase
MSQNPAGFNEERFMKIGTYYYPEQWPREQWERDFDNIARMGLQIVHMAEFAWHSLEPSAGEFEMDWLADCIEMAARRNLKVILCTPTAAPPIWLSDEFPDTLPNGGSIWRSSGYHWLADR